MTSLCPTCGNAVPPVEIHVDLDANIVTRAGAFAKLSAAESEIAYVLAKRAPWQVTHAELFIALWGPCDGPTDPLNCLRVYITRLRNSVRPLGIRIVNERRIGYRLILDKLALRCVA